jgi:protein-L-isoaspartate(D-aspartate) O-methyltransferase
MRISASLCLLLSALIVGSVEPCFCASREKQDYLTLRHEMVISQLQKRGINSKRVLTASGETPRHLFVPEKYRESAYGDFPLPIGHGQTIPQPYICALMTELLEPKPQDTAMEVGTGSGYQAALLSRIVRWVYTVEIIPPLADTAKSSLDQLGYRNITVRTGDGYFGWDSHAPFDCIVVTAVATHIPPPLIQQLKAGGKMVIPIGNPFRVQNLMLVEKSEQGEVRSRTILPVRFAPLIRHWKPP